MTTKKATKTEIQSAAIFRCVAKQSFTEKNVTIEAGETFYRVNSDTTNDSYIVRWNEEATQWECNCPSTRSCKHCRAAGEVCRDRKQFQPAAILAKHAATFNQDIVAFMQRAVAAKVEAQPASTSIGAAMADADTAVREAIEQAAVAGDKSFASVLDSFYEVRGTEMVSAPVVNPVKYRIECRVYPFRGESHTKFVPQHSFLSDGGKWSDLYFECRFDSAYEAREHLKYNYGAHDVEVVGEATYGTCGHLSKNEHDACPACRSKWYC